VQNRQSSGRREFAPLLSARYLVIIIIIIIIIIITLLFDVNCTD